MDPEVPVVRKAFPWLFVSRYVVGVVVLMAGLASAYWLSQSWASLLDRAFIEPWMSPYRYLPAIVLKIATGVAILARSKLSLALTLLWAIAFAYLLWGHGPASYLGSGFLLSVAVLVGLFAFLCLLLARGLLR